MAKRTIRIRSFSFGTPGSDDHVEAFRGDKVELSKEAIEFGESIGAFEGAKPAGDDAPAAPTAPDFAAMSVEEIEGYLRENKPTIPQVTNYVDGDPATARKVLSAEEAATGGQPRATLVETLGAIIGGDDSGTTK